MNEKDLTIHLYRKDEALASIRWAILSHNHIETLFWGLELYDSNMESDAIEMLAMTWITCIGFGSFACLESLTKANTLDRDEWCELLMGWSRSEVRDTTSFYLMLRSRDPISEYTVTFPHEKKYESYDDALRDTLRRGKVLDAWLLSDCIQTVRYQMLTPPSGGVKSQFMISNSTSSDPKFRPLGGQNFVSCGILEEVAQEKGRGDALKVIQECKYLNELEKRAAAFVLVTLDDARYGNSQAPLKCIITDECRDAIQGWDAENCMRARRVYKVRYDAILYLCERSFQPVEESNESEIQDQLESTLLASSYWKNVMKPYMKTERKREQFYDTFFSYLTHDIPDEWSLSDREKSHGRGLGKTKEQAFKQFIRSTFQRSTTLGIWNCDISTLRIPDKETDLEKDITKCPIQLTPIKKIFEILC